MIKIKNFSFYYGDAKKPALNNINLEIGDGEFVLVTGPSGGGKSSLCRCLNGLIPHFYGGKVKGQIRVQGLSVLRRSTKDMATKVGMVFQDPESQLTAMDVEREISFGMENLGFPRELMAKRLEESLDTIGIAHLRYRQIHELSGGEKQKVAIASVLALHPDILVLDEPTSELDPKGAEEVLSVVERLNDELGLTIVLIEHRLERVGQFIDRMIMVDNGEIVASGDPRQVMSSEKPEEIGVGTPPIIRLVRGLKNKGVEIEKVPLTVKEGRSMLDDIFRNASTKPAWHDKKQKGKLLMQTNKLWHAYPDGITALRDVNLSFYQGEFVAIMGRNASGKTTFIKHLNALLKPTKGEIIVSGVDTRKVTVAELSRMVGFVFQNPNDHLFADSVEDEIAFTLKSIGVEGKSVISRVDEMLEQFKITEYRKQYPRYLSGGERQRVALASVIVAKPKILILDEPTRGMDYRLKTELMNFLNEYRKDGNIVIMVTHDVEIVAEYTDRVVFLSEGRVIVDDYKRKVLANALLFSPQMNRLVQAFEKYDVPQDILTADEALEFIG